MMLVEDGYLRAWCAEDVPAAAFEPARSSEASVPASGGGALVRSRRAVVEVVREIGGLPQWALLGGSVQPSSDSTATLRICIAGDDTFDSEATLDSELRRRKLIVGLPSDYAGAVEKVFLTQGGGPRNIVIDRAAHDLVESSPVAFDGAARLLRYVLEHGHLPDADHVRAVVVPEGSLGRGDRR